MEDRSLAAGQGRVKFVCERKGNSSDHASLAGEFAHEVERLSEALRVLEEVGAAPICADGKIGGNGALLVGKSRQLMLVSRSGKSGGTPLRGTDFCFVSSFDDRAWTAQFYAADGEKPSSDTPLLWTALHQCWSTRPLVALHGHALDTVEDAMNLSIPISEEETLFSTPADTHALQKLFELHPYPATKSYIRKNHGFFLLSDSPEECSNRATALIKRALKPRELERQL